MAYATAQDCRDRRGGRAVERLQDGNGSNKPLERALDDASDEIDLYLGARHQLPLDPVPRVLKRLCVEIALYRAAADAARLTDEARQRYEDAIRLLKDIEAGKASLGAADPDPPAEAEDSAVFVDGANERVMTRESLRGLA